MSVSRSRAAGGRSTARSRQSSVSAETDGERLLSIGELAAATDVSQRTVRYYEEIGVFPPPPRTDGGTRRYPPEYVYYVEGAKTLKQRGFSLEEIVELGQWAFGTRKVSKRTQAMLKEQLRDLEYRITVLKRLHTLLSEAMSGTARTSPLESLLARIGREPDKAGGDAAH